MPYASSRTPCPDPPAARRARWRAVGAALFLATSALFGPAAAASNQANPAGTAVVASAAPLPLQAKSDTLNLAGLEQSFRDVARRVTPSVVAITASAEVAPSDAAFRSADLSADLVDRLLNGGPRIVGTGFAIDADGYILTNEHVVRDGKQLYVTADDGRTFPALVVGTDPRHDLAVLKIPGKLPPVSFAPAGGVFRGQWTVAIGNPVGLAAGGAMCMSVGVVSAVGRDLPKLSEKEGRLYTNLIQTTAEVNPGNSGGPLFDLQGNVLGIVTAVVLPHKTTNGIGFAMPADAAMRARVDQLKRGTPVVYGYLGIAVRDHAGNGVWVQTVGEDTPAAGVLQQGDLLVRIDGQAVTDEASFVRIVGAAPISRPVTLVVNRGGRELPLNVRLVAHPELTRGVDVASQRLFWRGLTLGPALADGGGGAAGGVQVWDVRPDSPLAALGVKRGSVIRAVAGKPVRDLVGLMDVLDAMPTEQAQLALAAPAPAAPGAPAQTAVASGAE